MGSLTFAHANTTEANLNNQVMFEQTSLEQNNLEVTQKVVKEDITVIIIEYPDGTVIIIVVRRN